MLYELNHVKASLIYNCEICENKLQTDDHIQVL